MRILFLLLVALAGCGGGHQPTLVRDSRDIAVGGSPRGTQGGAGIASPGSGVEVPPITDADFGDNGGAWIMSALSGNIYHAGGARSRWNKVPVSFITRYSRMDFISPDRGWVVRESGGQGEVWRTHDGGATWHLTSRLRSDGPQEGFREALQIKFVDERRGWIVAAAGIWRTEDQGENWKQVFTLSGRTLNSHLTRGAFPGPDSAWVCGSGGTLYSTSDGGKTWDVIKIGADIFLTDIFFADSSNGWVSSDAGALFRTRNAGKLWDSLPIADADASFTSIHFINAWEGWAVGGRFLGNNLASAPAVSGKGSWKDFIWHTRDGGASWEPSQIEDNDSPFTKIFFADQNRGWLTTSRQIHHSDDGGKTWRASLDVAQLVRAQ